MRTYLELLVFRLLAPLQITQSRDELDDLLSLEWRMIISPDIIFTTDLVDKSFAIGYATFLCLMCRQRYGRPDLINGLPWPRQLALLGCLRIRHVAFEHRRVGPPNPAGEIPHSAYSAAVARCVRQNFAVSSGVPRHSLKEIGTCQESGTTQAELKANLPPLVYYLWLPPALTASGLFDFANSQPW